MNTFFYRDLRKQKLQAALAALGDAHHELREPLQAEFDALQANDWTVSDRTYLAVGADWLWEIRLTLKMLVDDDPVLLALNQQALLTAAQAGAIEDLPHPPGGPPTGYLDQVRAAIDGDEAVFTELLHATHRRWLVESPETRLYPFDDVGVLLPLRLETLFDEPNSRFNEDPTRWKLSLRVIPDEASICRDNPHVSQGEQQVLVDFWNAVKQPGAPEASWLDGDKAEVSWMQLCHRVTPGRAAWLVPHVEITLDGEMVTLVLPADMPAKAQDNRVGGMTAELQVIATTTASIDGATRHPFGRLPMDLDKQIDVDALTLPVPANLAEERNRWWVNWEAARDVGLAGEWLLPLGMTPQNIDALYVIGIGDESPESHFKAQVDAGELGVLRLGAPTNALHGDAAAELGNDAVNWRKVAQMRLRQRANPAPKVLSGAGRNLHQYLVGSANELPFFPGADNLDDNQDSQRMMQALWPALWGHWLLDLWQVGEDAYRMGSWMMAHFWPEGPLMPLRIGDQPYGVLPVTALSQWQTPPAFNAEAQAQRAVEAALAASYTELRAAWADTVKKSHSVVNKTSEEFMHLLGRDALSRRYIQREFGPAWAQLAPYIALFGLDANQQQEFLDRAHDLYRPTQDRLEREPAETYLANGYWERTDLPLVQPTAMTYQRGPNHEMERFELPQLLMELLEGKSVDLLFNEEFGLHVLPDSLLIRLLIYAAQQVAPWRQVDMTPDQLNVAQIQESSTLDIVQELDQEAWRDVVIDEVSGEISTFIMHVDDTRRSELERALRATLDSAAHRIDPWVTGFAWQRLQAQSSSPRRTQRLGVYGWVDGPFNGQPGPTDAGRLHTPSHNQTLAALILRDKFLSSTRAGLHNGNGHNPWAMNISSRKARLAEEIADEVRMGFHIHEIVGRHVEHILGDQAGGHEVVRRVRTNNRYAMRPERKDPSEVCNGIEAVQGLLAGDADFPLTPKQQTAMQVLYDALDTYSDLLMADGVMQLVNRQIDRAAETMDAAAGFAHPPSFEFIRTPPSGYQLESVVLSALPYVAPSTLPADASPIRIADPSVMAFIEKKLGDHWVWTAHNPDDEAVIGAMTLAEMGFTPHETLALSEEFLRELAARKLGAARTAIKPPRQHALAQELVAALGSRPAAGRDFSTDPEMQPAADATVYAELCDRYQLLYQSCQSLIDQLRAAADDVTQIALLRRALIWGATPASEPADRETLFAHLLDLPLPERPTPLATLAENTAALLQKRWDDAPKPEELPSVAEISTPLDNHEDRKRDATPDGIPTLARAIANLASPNAKLAILACWSQATLVDDSELTIAQTEPGLDESWLTVIAASRAPLARLEALQLEMNPPLATWSNAPGDPWQQELVAKNLVQRDTPHEPEARESVLGLRNRRFVAVYGPEDAWSGDKVAVGMVDAFSEAIPMPHRTSTAAFGFNAPSARAPQAILLAVPPKPRQRLDATVLQQIVAETRELAHARGARMEDLNEFQALTPTLWLQSSGTNRVHLEPYPLFE